MQLAGQMANRIRQQYGNQILAIAVYGSVARNEDKKFSDTELVVITKNKTGPRTIVYRGATAFVEYKTKKAVLDSLRKIGMFWPIETSQVLVAIPLYDPHGLFDEFKRVVKSAKSRNKQFRTAEGEVLTWTSEDIDKVRNAYQSKDLGGMRYGLGETIFMINALIALFNKTHMRHGPAFLEDAKRFRILPKNYYPLMRKLWYSTDIEELYSSTIKLWRNTLKMAARYRVKPEVYRNLKDVKL